MESGIEIGHDDIGRDVTEVIVSRLQFVIAHLHESDLPLVVEESTAQAKIVEDFIKMLK